MNEDKPRREDGIEEIIHSSESSSGENVNQYNTDYRTLCTVGGGGEEVRWTRREGGSERGRGGKEACLLAPSDLAQYCQNLHVLQGRNFGSFPRCHRPKLK